MASDEVQGSGIRPSRDGFLSVENKTKAREQEAPAKDSQAEVPAAQSESVVLEVRSSGVQSNSSLTAAGQARLTDYDEASKVADSVATRIKDGAQEVPGDSILAKMGQVHSGLDPKASELLQD